MKNMKRMKEIFLKIKNIFTIRFVMMMEFLKNHKILFLNIQAKVNRNSKFMMNIPLKKIPKIQINLGKYMIRILKL